MDIRELKVLAALDGYDPSSITECPSDLPKRRTSIDIQVEWGPHGGGPADFAVIDTFTAEIILPCKNHLEKYLKLKQHWKKYDY